MKRKLFTVALAFVMVASLLAGAASAATTDLTDAENWITDRTEPANWKIEEGKITFSVKGQPQAEDWYAWQGRKAFTGADLSNFWSVEYQLDVTEEMLANNTNVSLWIQVDDAVGNAATQEDNVDWAIIQFICVGDTPKWQYWDDSEGWKDVESVPATEGSYTIKTEFENGTIRHFINGKEVASYKINRVETTPAAVIAQARSYGTAFGVTVGVPTVSTEKEKESVSGFGKLISGIFNLAKWNHAGDSIMTISIFSIIIEFITGILAMFK